MFLLFPLYGPTVAEAPKTTDESNPRLSVTVLGGEKVTVSAGLATEKFFQKFDSTTSSSADEESNLLPSARQPLGCVAWRGVSGCTPESDAADSSLELPCHATIDTNLAGWCECEWEYRVREVSCKHEIFRCDEQCELHTAFEARVKEETASRAELSPTDSVVAEFMLEPQFNNEFAPAHVNSLLAQNKAFAIFMLCDCDDDVRWEPAIQDMKRLPEWDAQIKDAFVFGYARTGAINSFDLLDNFAIEGAPALGIDNIPIGQNMEKHTFRMDKGGQLKWRPEIGQAPPETITGRELADFFLCQINRTLPLTVMSAPVPDPIEEAARGGARHIVGSNFEEVVLDEARDVAVFFYAPWCGGSNLVMPVIDRAAEKITEVLREKRLASRMRDRTRREIRKGRAADGNDNNNNNNNNNNDDDDDVLLVKMDLTISDIPVRGVSVRTYPALWLWPRGRKDRPLEYAEYSHERTDGDGKRHSHYELGMILDFLSNTKDHHVRSVHTDGGHADHLWDA